MTSTNPLVTLIAQATGLRPNQIEAVIQLLADGATIPFIARYRKERTGGMDEVQIAQVSDMNDKLLELGKRKDTILKTIAEQDKLTPELKARIEACWDATELEDIYLPFKPKRRTRAQVAREHGLEPLAQLLLLQREPNPTAAAARFVNAEVESAEAAIQGAQDIIAEMVSEDERSRAAVRNAFRRDALITSKVVKAKADTDEAQKFKDYFDWTEPLRRCTSHRLLAMRRGETEGILRVHIESDDEQNTERLQRFFVRGRGACADLVAAAVADGYKRLLQPSIETEFAALSKEQADEEAIRVFASNLRQLLLDAPLGQKRVMGIDPGFRTGCKVVCLDAQGNLLHHEAIFPHPPVRKPADAMEALGTMLRKYKVEAIAIGNGTASRETEAFVRLALDTLSVQADIFVVSEDGASVYSASKTARDEFPDEDVTVRGAVSIGRRLMDPLAELVKIDPKSIGVGQYQHDVDQAKLKHSLDQTVESCVNSVGVEVNTASRHLLTYVSGLGPTLAQNIVDYRAQHGPFASRNELLKVPRLGPAAFQQCAGFLRISGAKNPLDNSAVHPESYGIVERMAKDAGCTVADLIAQPDKRKGIQLQKYVTDTVGMPTLTDIMTELEKPGRDPRGAASAFAFDPSVKEPADLRPGMELPGIVTNITNFGAFVDVGVHQDGLVHVSQLADRYVKDPNAVVHLHQHVRVRVVEVDLRRNRISLSMRNMGD
ncbi:MAG: RNA-binding transcriptional accessory protein [Bacteroidaceae bacterium]|nr:RNA-binding transcriptional accessory protein [Bacteroidaceae bacterium]